MKFILEAPNSKKPFMQSITFKAMKALFIFKGHCTGL